MKLVFRGHDDRYAVEQSLLAFFPEERPRRRKVFKRHKQFQHIGPH